MFVQGWGEYMTFGLPSCMMLCLEWWLFEVANLISGVLPNPVLSLATMGICMQIMEVAFAVPSGVSTAVSIRISNLLGKF
jgi:multidrug resistance protein, MATE family